MNETDSQAIKSDVSAVPFKGRGVRWMRRLANIGFGIAALYFVYLVSILVIASRTNAELEGQPIGDVSVEILRPSTNGALVTESANAADDDAVSSVSFGYSLDKANVWSATAKKQVVVLWATWCGPCHSLLADLKEEVAGGKLAAENVLAVSMVEPLSDVAAYLTKTPLPFRVALDQKGILAERLKVSGTPTVLMLDENGVIHKVSTGGFGLTRKITEFLRP